MVATPDIAEEAGLRYVEEGEPGISRVRRGRGFSYHLPSGDLVSEGVRQRIDRLVIPPAWKEVWICRTSTGHIQATGIDDAGRKQYIYHPEWERVRDEVKFARLGDFGKRLTHLRKRLDSDLRKRTDSRLRTVALATAVLDRTLIRVGNRRYAASNDSYGLTTLTSDHVEIEGCEVAIDFEGKGGVGHQVAFEDRRLATLISKCQEIGGQTLFTYVHNGTESSVGSADINQYLSDTMNGPYTAKDFRTWGATTLVTQSLATSSSAPDQDRLVAAIDEAAEYLGNTRAVCRTSYLHPAIPESYESGVLHDVWRQSRRGKWLERSESAVRRILAD